jgi:membrane peptidoglycan carboxypeptidase
MELYLNVIEFGPGIYGVGPAAAHYFDTVPGRLSLAQALYLGSILPNPKRSYFAEDGRLKDHWHKYLQRLMQLAHNRKRISDSELEQGLRERIVRGQPAPDMDSEPAAKPEALDPDEPIAPSDDVPL